MNDYARCYGCGGRAWPGRHLDVPKKRELHKGDLPTQRRLFCHNCRPKLCTSPVCAHGEAVNG